MRSAGIGLTRRRRDAEFKSGSVGIWDRGGADVVAARRERRWRSAGVGVLTRGLEWGGGGFGSRRRSLVGARSGLRWAVGAETSLRVTVVPRGVGGLR